MVAWGHFSGALAKISASDKNENITAKEPSKLELTPVGKSTGKSVVPPQDEVKETARGPPPAPVAPKVAAPVETAKPRTPTPPPPAAPVEEDPVNETAEPAAPAEEPTAPPEEPAAPAEE